jgi:hypothetical protein
LARAAEKKQFSAGMRPPRKALVAGMTGNGRVNRDKVADLNTVNVCTGFHDSAGTFVADDERIDYYLAADSAGLVVMDIASANADSFNLEKDIGIMDNLWRRNFLYFYLTNAGQYLCLHKNLRKIFDKTVVLCIMIVIRVAQSPKKSIKFPLFADMFID